MRLIGFSTGALALGDFERGLKLATRQDLNAVELSALRQHELEPLVTAVMRGSLDVLLHKFQYVSIHAPSSIDEAFEPQAVSLLRELWNLFPWPIVVHPDAISNPELWAQFGASLLIENMDKRKPIGRTATELFAVFEQLPDASLCFDIGHARQVDPSMSVASQILKLFRRRIVQVHVSEVNSDSTHDHVSYGARASFATVAHLVPPHAAIILESRVTESTIAEEISLALHLFSKKPEPIFAH